MINQILTATMYEHQQETGKYPTRLYLGQREWEELKALGDKAWGFTREENPSGERRAQYRGAIIYRVDAESYVRVGN
jgi:hypothetical protein